MRRVVFSLCAFATVLWTTAALSNDDDDGSLLGPHFQDEIIEATRNYLASIGWQNGRCAAPRLESGLTRDCDVLPTSGPGSHPPRPGAGNDVSSAAIDLKCEEDNGGVFEFTDSLNASTYSRIKATFQNGIPIYIGNYTSLDGSEYTEYLHVDIRKKELKQVVETTPADDERTHFYTVLFVELVADLEQFVCHAPPEKRRRYFDLLRFNRNQLK